MVREFDIDDKFHELVEGSCVGELVLMELWFNWSYQKVEDIVVEEVCLSCKINFE